MNILTKLVPLKTRKPEGSAVPPGNTAPQAGMTVIVTDTEGAWRMADVIWVDGGARNPKVPTLFQVADVDTGVINWVNADLVTHICPRV